MAQSTEYRNARRRLRRQLDTLALRDEALAAGLVALGYPEPRLRPAGLETFIQIVVSQQISTQAAQSIWQRLSDAFPGLPVASIARCAPEQLREAGLSRQKTQYVQGLARAVLSKDFDPDGLAGLDDDAAIAEIVKLRGFGRWSAEIYLMFSLQRRDIFAADDLALQLALQKLRGLKTRPRPRECRNLTEQWAPYRTAGCLFLWHFYRGAPA